MVPKRSTQLERTLKIEYKTVRYTCSPKLPDPNLSVAPAAYCFEEATATSVPAETCAGRKHLQYYFDEKSQLPKLGHPTMVSGGACRIAGDLKYSDVKESFMIRNRSGRYAGYADRQLQHLHHVAQAFSRRIDEVSFLAEPVVCDVDDLYPPMFPSYVQTPPSPDPASVDTSETPSS